MTGQDEVQAKIGRDLNDKTNGAWDLYFGNRANDAVLAFGNLSGTSSRPWFIPQSRENVLTLADAFRPQNLYPILQSVLKERGLHFLVAPFSAAAQVRGSGYLPLSFIANLVGRLRTLR